VRDELTPAQAELVAMVDRTVADAGDAASPRELLGRLGAEGLLAVHYPTAYGGRGLTVADHAAVCERIGELGLPDVAHLVTVQAVGCTILAYGTEAQRKEWLPDIASGRLLASLLLSERRAGSDLAAIGTTATRDGDGWRINGVKSWSLYTDWSRLALCSVRTRPGTHRYDGISLFLLDLTAPGVEITPVPRAAGAPFRTVTLTDVTAAADAVLGPLHGGWPLLPAAIGFERAGFDYLTRASAWLGTVERAVDRLPRSRRVDLAPDLVRLRLLVDNARALAYHAANSALDLRMDEVAVSYAKLACSRAAQAVARWAGQELLAAPDLGPDGELAEVLHAAVAEAPEFTISGGAQELQLDQIAAEFPIGRAVR
jgi:alkylation response protein AidB-like acyl-CoA dehydrogenase